MFSCWNLDSFTLAGLVLAGILAGGFRWGFSRAQRKWDMALLQKVRDNVRRAKSS